jgi:hypothetical protein
MSRWRVASPVLKQPSESKTNHRVQGCQIESKSNRIRLSNGMFWLKSNRIVCRSNRMLLFFSIFWYDLIWRTFWNQKIKNNDSKKWKFYRKWSQMILPVVSDILVYGPLKIDKFHDCNNFFITAARCSMESDRKSNRYRIEIESNQKVSAPFESKIGLNWKQFDLTALGPGIASRQTWNVQPFLTNLFFSSNPILKDDICARFCFLEF